MADTVNSLSPREQSLWNQTPSAAYLENVIKMQRMVTIGQSFLDASSLAAVPKGPDGRAPQVLRYLGPPAEPLDGAVLHFRAPSPEVVEAYARADPCPINRRKTGGQDQRKTR